MQDRATATIAVKASGGERLNRERLRTHLVAAGGILGALAASSCCVLPLVLFSLGISGAWIGNLTALAPYKSYFAGPTIGLLGYAYYLVYLRPSPACSDAICAHPLPNRLVKLGLWIATALVAAALTFDIAAPLLLT